MSDFSKLRVAVVRGGDIPDYLRSLASGEQVLSILRADEAVYEPVDIFISKDGEWHRRGMATSPELALQHVDMVWNASRGAEKVLESLRLPFVGSRSVPSSFADTPHVSKDTYARHDLRTPAYTELVEEEAAAELMDIFRRFMHPVAVRTAERAHDPFIAHSYHDLESALKESFALSKHALVEEHMKGKRLVTHVLRGGRGDYLYGFLPVEVEKGSPTSSSASTEEHKEMIEMAKKAHEAFGLGHFSASSFIITPKGKIYITETDPLPDISKDSSFAKSLEATGWQPSEFVEHAIREAFKK